MLLFGIRLFGIGKKKVGPTPTPAQPVVAIGGLPAWATMRSASKVAPGYVPIVDVDAGGMYKAWLAELRTYYSSPANIPGEWKEGSGAMKDEWTNCLIDLNSDPTTSYWLEVAYQCGKMELQGYMRTFAFEIHIHDEGKVYAQKTHADGRGAHRAAGGTGGGREAREHFKRLRGFIPS